ncbi:hypothetical protein [Bradyrhizobium sp. RT7b]|uniref:hypothetical protein n=1 Tax=unclassified Bradyrhizobium TaxID=2631580 RepID=UPI0033990845
MQQVKIGLTHKQRTALDLAAKKNERTLSEEVRVRLANSLLEDDITTYSRVAGREVMYLAEIVLLSVIGKNRRLTDEDVKQAVKEKLHRAMAVAVTDWFTQIKSPEKPATEPDVEADAIGHASAKGLLVWTTGQFDMEPPDHAVNWLFDKSNVEEDGK